MSDVWELVHHERVALLRDLAVLDEDQWEVQSLSHEWTVRQVAAHLVDNARTTPLGLMLAMARARFDFDRQNAMGVERELGETAADTLEGLREVAHLRCGPPAPLDSRMVEEVVHGEDIRRPLGIARDYPTEVVERSLRYQARTSVSLGGGRQRIAGVCLRATDADLVLGDGPDVRGPALSLLLVTSGRRAALPDLEGPGVPALG